MDYRWGGCSCLAGATIIGRSLNHANDSKESTGSNKGNNLESGPHAKLRAV